MGDPPRLLVGVTQVCKIAGDCCYLQSKAMRHHQSLKLVGTAVTSMSEGDVGIISFGRWKGRCWCSDCESMAGRVPVAKVETVWLVSIYCLTSDVRCVLL